MQSGNTFEELTRCLSSARLSTYYSAVNSSDPRFAIQYYVYNTRLSENFYFLLQNLEVALRNSIYLAYNTNYSDPFFFLNESDSRERYKNKKEFHSRECWKMLCGARYQLIKRSENINDGKLIAELNFGFWSKLFSSNHKKYQTMWYQIFHTVFPYYSHKHSIDDALQDIGCLINTIRIFRNRVFHYEPIFNHDQLHQLHSDIIKVLGWLSPELQKLSLAFDEFNDILYSKKKINKKLQRLYPFNKKNRNRLKRKRRP